MSQMKLSDIWDKADKELTQVRAIFGRRKDREACAAGAIAYYAGRTEYLGDFFSRGDCGDYESSVERFEQKYGNISFLNDYKGWTFKQFADAARAIGE